MRWEATHSCGQCCDSGASSCDVGVAADRPLMTNEFVFERLDSDETF